LGGLALGLGVLEHPVEVADDLLLRLILPLRRLGLGDELAERVEPRLVVVTVLGVLERLQGLRHGVGLGDVGILLDELRPARERPLAVHLDLSRHVPNRARAIPTPRIYTSGGTNASARRLDDAPPVWPWSGPGPIKMDSRLIGVSPYRVPESRGPKAGGP